MRNFPWCEDCPEVRSWQVPGRRKQSPAPKRGRLLQPGHGRAHPAGPRGLWRDAGDNLRGSERGGAGPDRGPRDGRPRSAPGCGQRLHDGVESKSLRNLRNPAAHQSFEGGGADGSHPGEVRFGQPQARLCKAGCLEVAPRRSLKVHGDRPVGRQETAGGHPLRRHGFLGALGKTDVPAQELGRMLGEQFRRHRQEVGFCVTPVQVSRRKRRTGLIVAGAGKTNPRAASDQGGDHRPQLGRARHGGGALRIGEQSPGARATSRNIRGPLAPVSKPQRGGGKASSGIGSGHRYRAAGPLQPVLVELGPHRAAPPHRRTEPSCREPAQRESLGLPFSRAAHQQENFGGAGFQVMQDEVGLEFRLGYHRWRRRRRRGGRHDDRFMVLGSEDRALLPNWGSPLLRERRGARFRSRERGFGRREWGYHLRMAPRRAAQLLLGIHQAVERHLGQIVVLLPMVIRAEVRIGELSN